MHIILATGDDTNRYRTSCRRTHTKFLRRPTLEWQFISISGFAAPTLNISNGFPYSFMIAKLLSPTRTPRMPRTTNRQRYCEKNIRFRLFLFALMVRTFVYLLFGGSSCEIWRCSATAKKARRRRRRRRRRMSLSYQKLPFLPMTLSSFRARLCYFLCFVFCFCGALAAFGPHEKKGSNNAENRTTNRLM